MIKGNEAKPYAISVGNLEFNDKPRPKYIAIHYADDTHPECISLFLKDISPHQTYDGAWYEEQQAL